jgi:hypothetical protein
LSFFQTVRQLVFSRIDPHAFTSHTGRVSVLQNVHPNLPVATGDGEPFVDASRVPSIVDRYLTEVSGTKRIVRETTIHLIRGRQTSGLVDLFSAAHLADDIAAWSSEKGHDVNTAVNYLVLAVGLQTVDDSLALRYFEHAKVLALATLGSELSVATVQAFTLITLFMLRACQITGAFLFFGKCEPAWICVA